MYLTLVHTSTSDNLSFSIKHSLVYNFPIFSLVHYNTTFVYDFQVNNLTTYTNAVCCNDSTATATTLNSGESLSSPKYSSKREAICKQCKHENKFHFNIYNLTENLVIDLPCNEDIETMSKKDFIKKRIADLIDEQETIKKAALNIQKCLVNFSNDEANDGYAEYLNILANRQVIFWNH